MRALKIDETFPDSQDSPIENNEIVRIATEQQEPSFLSI